MLDILTTWMPNIMDNLPEFIQEIINTLIMIGITGIVSLFLGGIVGIILVVTRKGDIFENKVVYFVLGKVVDLLRAVPFIILAMFLAPATKAIMGTTIQLKGALFPLIIGTIPFFARQIESALSTLDHGLIEASQAMGCSKMDIIFRVYLKESIPSIIRATTITLIALVGYTAMVGVVGGGGIGDFCIRYGYQRFQSDVLYVCVIVLLVITTLIQSAGNYLVKKTTH